MLWTLRVCMLQCVPVHTHIHATHTESRMTLLAELWLTKMELSAVPLSEQGLQKRLHPTS